jgi:16S rRNA (uracil1498-N3)-methyltransferase
VDVRPRCFHPAIDASSIVLSEDESAHLTRVLRLRAGASVLVFDGRGHQRAGVIASATKSRATIDLDETVPAAPEPAVALTLAQAALKGDKMDEVIRDATMMGVAVIRPLVTARTVVPRAAVDQARTHDRWTRIALASAKQSGRAVVPVIAPAWTMSDLVMPDLAVSSPAVSDVVADGAAPACRLLLAEPATQTAGRTLPSDPPASALIAVGPEGGWTPEEVEQALAAGFLPLTLSARTLRAESAPLAALSVLSWVWKL